MIRKDLVGGPWLTLALALDLPPGSSLARALGLPPCARAWAGAGARHRRSQPADKPATDGGNFCKQLRITVRYKRIPKERFQTINGRCGEAEWDGEGSVREGGRSECKRVREEGGG